MTAEAVQALNIPVLESDHLYLESGLEWLQTHTTLSFSLDDPDSLTTLPSGAKLFLVKFCEIIKRDVTVSSETVGPLSKSFNPSKQPILSLARQLLKPYLLPTVQFIPCKRRWE